MKQSIKHLLGGALLFALPMFLTSCDDILGEWDKPSPQVQEVINTIVTVTGADPSAVTAALKAVVTDEAVAAAAAKGEPIKVTVAGSGVSTDAADQTITIPQKSGAAIEINFATVPSGTDSNALVLEASEGAGTLPGDANNNLVVTMPPSEGLAITIELPQTTVTLKTDGTGAVVYKDVIAKTAKSTIIIDKGVTIKEHELVGGNIIVKDGGAIETLAVTIKGERRGMVCLGSWWCGVSFKGADPDYEIKKEDGSYYLPKHVIVRKGVGNHITAWTNGPKDETIESLTAGNGVNVSVLFAPQYKVIKGEGDNELLVQGGINKQNPNDESDDRYEYAFASNTDLVSNFAIKAEIDDDPVADPRIFTDPANLIINFNAVEEGGSKTFTFENCNFDSNLQFALSAIRIVHYNKYVGFVNPGDERPMESRNLNDLLNAGIPNNIVERGQTSGGYWINDEYDDEAPIVSAYTCILEFKNCKIGGENITITNNTSTDPPTYQSNLKFTKWGLWDQNNHDIKFKVIVDGTTYIPATRWYTNDKENPNYALNGTIELELPHD